MLETKPNSPTYLCTTLLLFRLFRRPIRNIMHFMRHPIGRIRDLTRRLHHFNHLRRIFLLRWFPKSRVPGRQRDLRLREHRFVEARFRHRETQAARGIFHVFLYKRVNKGLMQTRL